ncbi:Hint domain-containing protein [Roseovarius nubinhibens]|uniref:Hedgehog/Intein (Hint) domain-containing protein n=1 Tax=Roseovarius nubinhibens TaxID=314263 RepID=A0A348W7B2_9RHOB|nr:hypothetical protein [Roseovarius nubinhibens]
MPIYFSYAQTIRGTQTSVNGGAPNYAIFGNVGDSWSWTGAMETRTVFEINDTAVNFNGDPTDDNEGIAPDRDIGGSGQQSMEIGGVQRAVIYDYSFSVTDGTNTYEIAVIDADLDADSRLDSAGEDGYYLIFIGTPPPPDTALTINNAEVDNSTSRTHASMGGQAVCFMAGTLIATDRGPRRIETLQPGDRLRTLDHGWQPLRWLGQMEVLGVGRLAPVRIARGALGNDRTLWVSPQHRMLVSDWRAELLFGASEVLVPAIALVDGQQITRVARRRVSYCHLLFDRHQIIHAEGCLSESLYPGEIARGALGLAGQLALRQALPGRDLSPEAYGPLARPTLRVREGALLRLRGYAAQGRERRGCAA